MTALLGVTGQVTSGSDLAFVARLSEGTRVVKDAPVFLPGGEISWAEVPADRPAVGVRGRPSGHWLDFFGPALALGLDVNQLRVRLPEHAVGEAPWGGILIRAPVDPAHPEDAAHARLRRALTKALASLSW